MTDESREILLSLAMMVKDEEDLLPAALASVKGLVDEMVVVDTGSTDRTVEIAQEAGAMVMQTGWADDFSLHRNQSMDYCTGKWILILDADEALDRTGVNVDRVREVLRTAPVDINFFTVTVKDTKKDGSISHEFPSIRILRNGVGARYENCVHNKLRGEGKAAGTDLVIHHFGYDLAPEKMETKATRTLGLLRKRIDENPDDHEAYYYLANYLAPTDPAKAMEYGRAAIECFAGKFNDAISAQQHLSFLGSIYHTMAMCAWALRDWDSAVKWVRHGLKLLPEDLDLNYDLTTLGAAAANLMIMSGGTKYLEMEARHREDPRTRGPRFAMTIDKKCRETVEKRLKIARMFAL